jgi:hypothetical protein
MNNMKVSEQLKVARELISDEDSWLRNEYANGKSIQESTCFCSLGAIFKARGDDWTAPDRNAASETLAEALNIRFSHIADWNDSAEHFQVLEGFDKAIALAEAGEGTVKGIYYPIAQHLQHFCKDGQFVLWRDAFRWKRRISIAGIDECLDEVLSNHYDGMELEQLAEEFGYEIDWEYNLKHVAIVRKL